MVLVGFCGSTDLSSRWRRLVGAVVASVIEAGRGIAVGTGRGAEAMALRACFTDNWSLRAPYIRVFAECGPGGEGAWKNSAVQLVQEVAQYPTAMGVAGNGRRIIVSWWAGGDPEVPLGLRLQGTVKAMVTAVDMTGNGKGLAAFVTGGAEKSPMAWFAIREAHERGLPIVIFPCGCTLHSFPALGEGHWATAGSGVWERGWRWVEEASPSPMPIGEAILDLLGFQPARPRRKKVELDVPLFLNLRRWAWQSTRCARPDL